MKSETLTAELAFARLEELRELLRLVDHLQTFRRAEMAPKGPGTLTGPEALEPERRNAASGRHGRSGR